MSADRPTVLIMAGGTGGHVYPALAIATLLREEGIGVRWLGTRKGLEADVVPRAGLPIDFIDVAGLRGKGLWGWLAAPLRIARALAQAIAIVRRLRPSVVIGLGGFATGPGGIAARLLGRPLVIHEQNAVAGLTNRLLSPIATVVLEAFPGTFAHRRGTIATGNPVRQDIVALPTPAERFQHRTGALRLLVVGGSLGAKALNELVPAALALLDPAQRPAVRHQTGRGHDEAVRQRYATFGVKAEVTPFVEDMAEVFGWADLAICRAGALTVSELAAAGLGAVLVPFPYAVDDHQARNAEYLAAAGAAVVVQQSALDAQRLAQRLREFCAGGRGPLLAMAQAARRMARPDAAREVVRHCVRFIDAAGTGEGVRYGE